MQTQPYLQNYLQLIMRRRWVIFTFFIVLVAAVLIGSLKQTPIYESSITLMIERKSPHVISVQEVSPLGTEDLRAYRDYYETQYKLIKGRLLLKRVSDSLDLNGDNVPRERNVVEELIMSIKVTFIRNGLIKAANFLGLSNDGADEEINSVERLSQAMEVKPVRNSQLVEIIVEDPDPVMAAKIANTVADEYIRQNLERNTHAATSAAEWLSKKIKEQRQKLKEAELALQKYRKRHNINILPQTKGQSAVEDIKAEYARLQALLANYSQRYTEKHPKMIELRAQINSLRNKIHGLEDFDRGSKTMEYMVLEREVQTNKHMYETLLARLKEIDLSSTLNVNNISIIDRAEVPEKPSKPNLPLNMALSVVAGLVMGIGLGFFVDYMDTTIKSPQDIKDILQIHFLGNIPRFKGKDEAEKNRIVHFQPRSPVSEAYREIRTEILNLTPKDRNSSILITSAEPKAGKTITVVNLGIALSQKGNNVLLVDTDLRKPQIHKIFDSGKTAGLSGYLSGDINLDSIIKDTEIENLKVVTSGKVPNNLSEIISSDRMSEFISGLKQKFDFVLFDSPPIASVTDAVILADLVDATIQVVRSGKSHVPTTLSVKEKLANTKTKILGVILNDLKTYHDDYYYYKYYRYYNEKAKERRAVK